MNLRHKKLKLVVEIGDRKVLLDKHDLSDKRLYFWSIGNGCYELTDFDSILNF